MNRKQFIILLVLVVFVGAAGLLIRQHNSRSWQSGGTAIGQKLLPNLAVNDIAQIVIQSGTNELNLARRDNFWRVRERGDYPANFSQISELLLKLADLKVAQREDLGPSQLGRFELLSPGTGTNAGTRLEFKDQSGKTLDSMLLGKKHLKQPAANSRQGAMGGMGDEGWPDGRYVMTGTGAKTVAVISDPLDQVQSQPQSWLDPEFFSLEKPRRIAVQFAEATNSWQLTRASETNDWQLADAKPGEKLDETKITTVTSPFSSARFSDVAPLDSGKTTNGPVLTVETFDGFTYVVRIGQKQEENYPVSFSLTANLPAERVAGADEKAADKTRLDQEFKARQTQLAEKRTRESAFTHWIYSLPADAVDPVIKTRGDLLVEVKKDEAPKAEK
jgi:hypothetical protein